MQYYRSAEEGEDTKRSWKRATLPERLVYFEAALPGGGTTQIHIFRTYYDPHLHTPETRWVTMAMRHMLVRIVRLAADTYRKNPTWSAWNLAAAVARLYDLSLERQDEGHAEPYVQAEVVSALAALTPTQTKGVMDLVRYFYDDDTGTRNKGAGRVFMDRIESDAGTTRAIARSEASPASGTPSKRARSLHARAQIVGKERLGLAPSPYEPKRRMV